MAKGLKTRYSKESGILFREEGVKVQSGCAQKEKKEDRK